MLKFIRNWFIVFISCFIWSFIWHSIILVKFYNANLVNFATYVDGLPAPNMPFLALGNLLAVFGFAYFLPKVANTTKDFLLNGVIMGLLTWGTFAVTAHAIASGWTAPLMIADLSYSITAGLLGGFLMSLLSKKKAQV